MSRNNKKSIKMVQDLEMQAQKFVQEEEEDDDHDCSLSSSDSEKSASKQFCEDSTTAEGRSSSKQTASTVGETATSKWFDDSLDASRSSSLILALVVVTAIILGSVVFIVAKKQDKNNFHSKVNACHAMAGLALSLAALPSCRQSCSISHQPSFPC